MSRPIPIKSPRESQGIPIRSGGAVGRISQSLPVPASPHFGSLKAPPEFLTGMPPLSLPQSFTENQKTRLAPKKDVLAKSAPAADLELPLHRYRVEDKRKPMSVLSSSVGKASMSSVTVSMAASVGKDQLGTSLGQSLAASINALRIQEIIEEGEEGDEAAASPHASAEKKGIVLRGLQETLGLATSLESAGKGDILEELDLTAGGEEEGVDDDELQFELS